MKRVMILTAAALLFVAIVPAWSAKKAVNESEKIAEKLLDLDKTVKEFEAQMEKVTTSLSTLTSGQGDLKQNYMAFSKESKKMQSMANSATKSAQNAAEKREAYLKSWEENQKSIQNEQLKAAAEARRNQLLPIIDKIKTAAGTFKEKFTPFTVDLKDIETYLGNDLTPTGLNAVQPMAQKCTGDGETLKSALTEFSSGIRELAGQIGPGKGTAED
jgi:chromosome segregation ATPase